MEEPLTVAADSVGRYTVARTWELTPRLVSAFAAGVDDPNPAYLDDARAEGLIGHPGLAFTFQWNSRHMPGVHMEAGVVRRGVHAWVDIRYARPFRGGDAITAQGRTIAMRQLRPGVLSVQRVTMSDAAGEEVAVMDTGGILRGCTLDGPDVVLAESPPRPLYEASGGAPAWESVVPIAPHAAHVYTECADIWNPIHTERAVALAAGLPDIILHGSATITIALREVINHALGGDPTRVARLAGEFRAMVIPGQPMTVRCLGVRPSDAGTDIFFEVLNLAGQPAVARGLVSARG